MSNDIRYLLRSQDPEDRKEGIKYLVRSNHPQAMEYLRRLYDNDPDPSVRDLAMRGAQRLQQQAQPAQPQFLDDPYADYDYVDNTKAKRAKRGEPVDDISGGRALVDVLIMFFVVGFVTFGLIFVPTQILASVADVAAQTLSTDPSFSAASAGEFSDFSEEDVLAAIDMMVELLRGAGITLAIVSGLATATLFVLFNLIYFALIHFVSAVILRGVGGFAGLIHRLTLPTIVSFLVPFAFMFVSFILVATAVADVGTMAAVAESSTEMDQAIEQAVFQLANMSTIMSVIQLVVSIGLLFWFAYAIGKNYDFGTGKGCISLLLTYVLIFVMSCGCIFVLSSVFAGTASSIDATFNEITLTLEGLILLH